MAEKYIVEGYEFDTIEDANIAKKELEAVKFMSQKTNGCTPEVAFKIYNKIVQGNLFKTAIGYDYLRSLEEYLVTSGVLGPVEEDYVEEGYFNEEYTDSGSTEQVMPQILEEQQMQDLPDEFEEQELPVEPEVSKTPVQEAVDVNSIEFLKSNVVEEHKEESPEVLLKKLKATRSKLNTSIFFNVLLAIIVVVMLYIASTSSSVNIINYETALQDKYSSWAEELKEKENQLNEREKALEELEKNK